MFVSIWLSVKTFSALTRTITQKWPDFLIRDVVWMGDTTSPMSSPLSGGQLYTARSIGTPSLDFQIVDQSRRGHPARRIASCNGDVIR